MRELLETDTIVGNFIDGALQPGSHDAIQVIDPSFGTAFARITQSSRQDIDAAVAAASTAFSGGWGRLSGAERGRYLVAMAQAIREQAEQLATVEATDAGVPLPLALNDVETAARYFEFYAGAADKIMGSTIPVTPNVVDFTLREPWGVCAILIPFNFPLQMFARSVAPALAAGNTVVVKTADASSLSAIALGLISAQLKLPAGAINIVHGDASAGEALVSHPNVAHVSFTGSGAVGSAIMASCAKRVVPLTLELGGKSPYLILGDDDLDEAIATAGNAMFRTAGQACSAPTRIIVASPFVDTVKERVAAFARAMQVTPAMTGDGMGPVITERQRDAIEAAIAAATESGASVLAGGARPSQAPANGFYLEPTVLWDQRGAASASHQEIFGPVLTIIEAADHDEALTIANDTEFGLVAGVWTRDIKLAMRFATELKVGQVFINAFGAGAGVELPFGGYKRSGIGREKGLEALYEYTQVKNVLIKMD